MSLPKRIDELDTAATAGVSVSAGASVAVVTGGKTIQTPMSTFGSLGDFLQSGAGAVSRTFQDKDRDIVSVKDFGAVGDGITNDAAAVQAAIDTGKSVYFPEGTYFLGTFSTASTEVAVLTITGKSHVKYYGPGILQVTSGSTCVPKILTIDNSHDIDIDLSFNDTGFDHTILYRGAMAVNLLGTAGPVYNIKAVIRGTNLVVGFNTGNQNATTPANAIYDIKLDLSLSGIIYGALFRNSGDRVTGRIVTKTVYERSYFVYGVRDHIIDVLSDTKPAATGQDILIKVYDGPNTQNIKVKYSCTNFVSATSCVYIGNETTSGKVTRDIDVEINDIDSTNTNTFSAFIQSTTLGVADTTTTKVITNLKFSGHCRWPPYIATLFQTTTFSNQLVIEVSGEVERKMTSLRSVFNFDGSGSAMPGLASSNNHRWQFGGKLHSLYAGLINSAVVEIPLAVTESVLVPVEMYIVDSESSGLGYVHKAMTFFAQNNAGTINVFATATDWSSTNGSLGTITQGVGSADGTNSNSVKFTFSGWQTAPNGNSGYLCFTYPDLNKSETIN